MELVTNINEETKEINFGVLKFNSGKKIMLDADEVQEVLYKYDSKHTEGKLYGESLTHITSEKEFFVTGAYVMGVEHGGKKLLMVTQIEEDTFCDGEACNDRVEEEYKL